MYVENSVADPDPGSSAFLTTGSGIRDGENPDPASEQFLGYKYLNSDVN